MVPLQGEISTFGFADLLQWMELNRRSGRLTLVRGNDRRAIDWKEGEIVYVSGSLPRDRLAAFLHRTKALPAATLHALLARNFTTDTNLTRLILDGGHDTLPQLSRRVEELARRLLFQVFEWPNGRFEYDPTSRVERILRIHLKLPAQALAFQAVKALDEAHRGGKTPERGEETDPTGEADEGDPRFWDVVERAGLSLDPREGRRCQSDHREFSRRLREQLGRFNSLRPVHEDTAALLRKLAKRKRLEAGAVVPIAAIDPSLTLDLLVLANSLVVERRNSVLTARDALDRLGPAATAALVERLCAPDFPPLPSGNAEAAIRRASLAAAIAARRLAPRFETTPDRAYTLGLLHAIPYAELIAVAEEMNLPPGPFRAALVEAHRPLVGCRRAEAWSLPLELEAVLADAGAAPSPSVALVRAARATLPDCALGPLPAAGGSIRAARAAATELNRLFETLGLPPASVTPPAHVH